MRVENSHEKRMLVQFTQLFLATTKKIRLCPVFPPPPPPGAAHNGLAGVVRQILAIFSHDYIFPSLSFPFLFFHSISKMSSSLNRKMSAVNKKLNL
jgi:hypothetical protein